MYVLDYSETNAGDGDPDNDIAEGACGNAGGESVSGPRGGEPFNVASGVHDEMAQEQAEEERAQRQQPLEIGDPESDALEQPPQHTLSGSLSASSHMGSQLGSHGNSSLVLADGAVQARRPSASSAQLISDAAGEVAERQKLAKFLQQERAVDDLVGALCL